MDNNIWKGQPNDYCELTGESRVRYLHPLLREIILEKDVARVLDYGCGNGSLLRPIVDNFEFVCLHDTSRRMLRLVKELYRGVNSRKIEFVKDSSDIPPAGFECVVLSLVLMTIDSREEIDNVLANIVEALEPKGQCIVAVTHPCFRDRRFSTFATEYCGSDEGGFEYLSEGHPFKVQLTDSSQKKELEFTDYHWSLEFLINRLVRSGIIVTEVQEVADETVNGEKRLSWFPGYLVVRGIVNGCENAG